MDQGVEERVARHGQGAEGGGVGDDVKCRGGEGGGDEWSLGDICSTKLPGLRPSLPTGEVISLPIFGIIATSVNIILTIAGFTQQDPVSCWTTTS